MMGPSKGEIEDHQPSHQKEQKKNLHQAADKGAASLGFSLLKVSPQDLLILSDAHGQSA